MTGWRGIPGPYGAILPGTTGGGGLQASRLSQGTVQGITPGSAGGGGQVPSSGDLLANGCGGCGGPGPGMT